MSFYITPFITLLIILGVFFGYIDPTYTQAVAGLNTEIANYDRALAAADNYLAKQDEIAKQQGALSDEDTARLKAFLPDGIDNVQLILDLNSLAARTGVKVTELDIKASDLAQSDAPATRVADKPGTQGANSIGSLNLNLKFTATYTGLISFVSALEQSLRPIDVMNMSVSPSGSSKLANKDTAPTDPSYDVDMTLRVYWLQ